MARLPIVAEVIEMLERVFARLLRVVRLDGTVYDEIQQDEHATAEAVLVVAVASLLAALGSALGARQPALTLVRQFLAGVLLNWLLWTAIVHLVGSRLYAGRASFAGLARALGYAVAPTALGILSVFGCLGLLATFGAWIISLVTGFLAVRETLDLSSERAAITVGVAWLLVLGANVLLSLAIL